MTMTAEDVVANFGNGTFRPLQGAAEELQGMARAYQELVGTFDALRNQMSTAWTGPAAFASSERANELCTAVNDSAGLLDTFARAHDAQSEAFTTAATAVVPMPPNPDRPDVLEMIRAAVTEGPAAPFERAAGYLAAKQAYDQAAEHNLGVYDDYYWATTDNHGAIPVDYPRPVLVPGLGEITGEITGESGGEVELGDWEVEDGDPGGGGPGDSGGGPGGGGGPGDGGGTPGGGRPGGGSLGDPGSLDVTPVGDDPSGPGLPPPGSPPPGGWPPGVTAPNDAGPPVVHNPPNPGVVPEGPPPRNPLPPLPPLAPIAGSGPGGRDPSRDGDGGTHAARAGTGADPALGMPFGGMGDRVGGDQHGPGSQVGRGAGGPGGGAPGGTGAGVGAGTFGGGRAGGQGGLGAVPAGNANREEDKEHTRPEYLIEPDPDEIFGSDQSVSSPVIGAEWRPEQ